MTLIKHIYFYLFAAVGLVFVLIGLVQLIQLGLRAYVFPESDLYRPYPAAKPVAEINGATSSEPSEEELIQYQREELVRNRQRQATSGLSFLIVGIPLFWFHFRVIRKGLT
jgi:hypothetical protein